MLNFATTARAPLGDAPNLAAGQAAIATIVLILVVIAFFALRAAMRDLQVRRAQRAIGNRYADFVREALVNAAKIDGRVNDHERRAIASALSEATGASIDSAGVEAALAGAQLSKGELVSYLSARANSFSTDQKAALLKALLAVFVSDGHFDETEHAALIDYTAAIGYERQGAVGVLRGLADIRAGNIV